MEEFLSRLENIKNELKLDPSIKQAMRVEIEKAMAVPPATFSPYAKMMRFAYASSFLIVAGFGVCVSAEGALPGDFLYPVKVNFNEKIAAKTKVSALASATYATKLANKRLQEFNDLEERGRLTDEVRVESQQRYENQVLLAQNETETADLKEDERAALKTELAVSVDLGKKIFLSTIHPSATTTAANTIATPTLSQTTVNAVTVAAKKIPLRKNSKYPGVNNVKASTTASTTIKASTPTTTNINTGTIKIDLPLNGTTVVPVVPSTGKVIDNVVNPIINNTVNQVSNTVNQVTQTVAPTPTPAPVTNTVNTITNTVNNAVNSVLPKLGL